MNDMDSIINQRAELKVYFIQHKIDLEQKVDQIVAWGNCFTICNIERRVEDEQIDLHKLTSFFNDIRPAFVGPAYCLNNYIDAYIEDVFWDDVKYDIDPDQWTSSSLRAIKITVEMQNCLLAIKSGLDRLVRLFAIYDRGISSTSTFGRIKENGRGKGFMSQVISAKDSNPLYSFIYDEYHQWIKDCVRPRDAIVHYSDFATNYGFDSNTLTLQPVGINEGEAGLSVGFSSLVQYVNRYYNFYDKVTSMISKQERPICGETDHCQRCWIDSAFNL